MVALGTLTVLAALAGAADEGPFEDPIREGTPAEREALVTLEAGKHILAREQAEAILAEGPSLIATWVLAEVYFEGEGNLARSYFLVQRATRELEDEHGDRPAKATARRWHRRLLSRQANLLGEMDRRPEQLEVLDRYDDRYAPKLEARRIWPLMKLGRYDEARALALRLTLSDDRWIRRRAFNGLMALEYELHNRKATYEAGRTGWERTQESACIIALNTADSALVNFDFAEAARYDRASLEKKDEQCTIASLTQLSGLALLQGELQRSISTLEQLQTSPMNPALRPQHETTVKGRLVELLYALGQLELAEERAVQIIEGPDRVGLSSRSSQNARVGDLVLYWAVLDARVRQLEERAAARPWLTRWKGHMQRLGLRARQWEARRMAIPLAARQELFVTMARPYLTAVRPWYAGTLAAMFGVGLVRKAAAEARALETDYPTLAGAYLDALEGEAAWRQGELADALRLGAAALDALPQEAALLRWRTRTWIAAALLARGETDGARAHLHEALRHLPSALRHLGVALPVRIEHRGGAVAEEIAERLMDCPRFSEGDIGFLVDVRESEEAVKLCLRKSSGLQYACSSLDRSSGGSEDDVIGEAIDAFLDRAFSPKVDLTQADINTLDGSTIRIDAQDALRAVLGEGEEDGE